ncbi:Flp pilus assembly protein TadG [Agromyces ramosus]|uniref:Flp pilus assembly protein TadG n=1 Tax=Agromyces ramosus TaxID=33879 RepID=A0ABU0RB36_9MICO|nr:Flp pilus assembly protein TadG [Agromyces ramosus]
MRSRSADGDRGSVTAEFAVALPAIALVLAACLASVQLVAEQVRLTDAAADAARALGRGETEAVAAAIADRITGGAALAVSAEAPFVCVTLSSAGDGFLAAIELRAESCAVSGGL